MNWILADRKKKKSQVRIIAPHIRRSIGNCTVQNSKACQLHEQVNRKSKKLDGHKPLVFRLLTQYHLMKIILPGRSKSLPMETGKSLKLIYNWILIHHIYFSSTDTMFIFVFLFWSRTHPFKFLFVFLFSDSSSSRCYLSEPSVSLKWH